MGGSENPRVSMCRICMTAVEPKISIFGTVNGTVIAELLMLLTSVKVEKRDRLPKHVCAMCLAVLRKCQTMKNLAIVSDRILRDLIPNHEGRLLRPKRRSKVTKAENYTKIGDLCTVEIGQADLPTWDERIDQLIQKIPKPKDPNQRFPCPHCGNLLKTQVGLTQHIQNVHAERKFECPVCNKQYSNKEYLKHHIKIHAYGMPVCCTTCGKTFTKKSSLISHERIHTGEKPFVCQVCGEMFRHKVEMVTHQVSKHPEIELKWKTYGCTVCGKEMASRHLFRRHSMMHTDEKPFVCELCGVRYRKKISLRNHMTRHHQSLASPVEELLLNTAYPMTQ